MAWKQITTGIGETIDMLVDLGEQAEAGAAYALYEGAGAMADAITAAVKGIKTAEFHYAACEGTMRLPSPEEKAVLLGSLPGIAKFDKNGSEVNTSIGFQKSGYAEMLPGKIVPVPLIANAINSGTSFMQKQPFFRKAVNSTKKRAEQKTKAALEEYVEKRIKTHNNGGNA